MGDGAGGGGNGGDIIGPIGMIKCYTIYSMKNHSILRSNISEIDEDQQRVMLLTLLSL
jgi:hypothetical protein